MTMKDEYRQVYRLTCFEYEGDREMVETTQKFDATDFNLNEVLGVVEDFLINSGYDWLEPGSLTYKPSGPPNLESFGLFNNKGEKHQEENLAEKNLEAFERFSGIDRTAKIVQLNDHKKTEDPKIQELDKKTMEWLDEIGRMETGREPFEHLGDINSDNYEVHYTTDAEFDVSYDKITDFNYTMNVDFSEHEYKVDKDDNIIEDDKP